MSFPAPATVNVPFEALAVPLTAGLPISPSFHGDGRLVTLPLEEPETLSNVAVAADPASWLVTARPTYTVDAIVMGKVGARGTLETLLFGSTAERVLRGSRCPVVVLPVKAAR